METVTFTEEKISHYSDQQLLALLLSSDSKSYISTEKIDSMLEVCNQDWNQFYTASMDELVNSYKVRFADALRIKVAFELTRRNNLCEILKSRKIHNINKVREFFARLSTSPFEEAWVIILTATNHVLAIEKIGEGGQTSTIFDVKRALQATVKVLGQKLVMVHNHPNSLNIQPSEKDINTTEYMLEVSKVLNIKLLDHIILGNHGYYSFFDNGKLS